MADKATKIKIVSWCLMIALCVFAGALSLYFFVFNRAPNERGHEIYADLNQVLTSKEQQNVNIGLGAWGDTKNAQNYAQSSSSGELGPKFKALYLCYCVDKEIVDTYQFEAAYLSNADFKMAIKLDNAVKDYKSALANVQNYLDLFNQSYVKAGGTSSEETKNNFSYMLNSFGALETANHTLAMGLIEYVDKVYYGFEEKLNKYCTEKFVLTYALSCESNTIYTNRDKLCTLQGDSEAYRDASAQLSSYKTNKSTNFDKQVNDEDMLAFMSIMIGNGKAYIPFFESANKKDYYTKAAADAKTKLLAVAKGLGIDGRLS